MVYCHQAVFHFIFQKCFSTYFQHIFSAYFSTYFCFAAGDFDNYLKGICPMNDLVSDLSSTKNTKAEQRTIFHVDVNSAYLSWSALKQLSLSPGSVDLRTVPAVIAGDPANRHRSRRRCQNAPRDHYSQIHSGKKVRDQHRRAGSKSPAKVPPPDPRPTGFYHLPGVFPPSDGDPLGNHTGPSAGLDR